MTTKELTVINKLGMHARPAGIFVREAARFKSSIVVVKDGLEINGKSIMGLLMLAAECGSKLTVKTEGPDEKEAAEAIARLFQDKFGED
jgi:phosphocarrier protein HPr